MAVVFCCIAGTALVASAAYHHAGSADTDAGNFLRVYPDKAGTKLDNCATCHTGGKYTPAGSTKESTLGSCQYCHAITEYGTKPEEYPNTLNSYGKDYKTNGRSDVALGTIQNKDSDGDTYSNIDEINATRYPGDANDDPSKVVAPFRIYTKKQLQAMPQHKQFMLMNTTKSGDYYVEYSGVVMENLLKKAGISTAATEVFAYSPDGYAQRHPLKDSSDNTGKSYAPFVVGSYPQASYFYAAEADKAINDTYGWCDYSSPNAVGRQDGDPIRVKNGLRLLLALKADGTDLVPGVLGEDNKLTSDSEGPFRVVSPEKILGPPDQPSTKPALGSIWQYNPSADHNAGFSTKCATMIKVDPLPDGTTDIDVMEAGWGYVDQGKIVVYGALQGPQPIFPADGATKVNWHPTFFKWRHSPGVERKAVVSYKLEYTTDETLTTWTTVMIERSAKKAHMHFDPMVKDNTTITLEPSTRYWWRVTDLDENGGTTVSAVRSFTTKAKPAKK
jgi:cytochrome c553